jgi:hypothetical protein
MYNKEKAKQNYINNRDKLNEKAKQYYQDHKEARQKYNSAYWEEHKQKYLIQRRKDDGYKKRQKEYFEIYKDRPKVNINHSKNTKNNKLTKILMNHKPPPLNLSHTLYFD